MNNITKQVVAGTILGLMVSIIGSFIFVLIALPVNNIEQTIAQLLESGLITKVITIGTLLNVIVFHLLIKNNRVYIARGIVMSVIVLAIFFAFLKFR